MKKRNYLFVVLIAAISTSMFIISCGKNKREVYKQTSEDNTLAEGVFADVFNQVNDAAKNNDSTNKVNMMLTSPCATLTISPADTVTFPKTLTIDFGTTNCTGTDGRTRRGKIIAVLSGRYRDSATVVTVTFNNYYVNDNQVQGTKTITNKGHVGHTGGTNNLVFAIKVTNASITTATGIITWNSEREREWIAGETTPWPAVSDDIYLITGSADGINRNGKAYTVAITTALRVDRSCGHIVSGVIEITPEDLDKRTLDFGDGTCDNKATLTVKNKTYEITLR